MKTLPLLAVLTAALALPCASASAAIVAGGPTTAGTFALSGASLSLFPSPGGQIAAADFNGDRVDDLILGGSPRTVVRDGRTHAEIRTFPGGIYVAAGDVTGDGRAEIVLGDGPVARVYEDHHHVYSFVPFNLSTVSVAAGDVDGDGLDDVIVSDGPGGGAHVKVYSGLDGSLLRSFTAGGTVHALGAGDLDGDGRAEILTGTSGVVRVYDEAGLRHAFFAGTSVAALDGERGTIAVADSSLVRVYDAETLALRAKFTAFRTVTGVAIQTRR